MMPTLLMNDMEDDVGFAPDGGAPIGSRLPQENFPLGPPNAFMPGGKNLFEPVDGGPRHQGLPGGFQGLDPSLGMPYSAMATGVGGGGYGDAAARGSGATHGTTAGFGAEARCGGQ